MPRGTLIIQQIIKDASLIRHSFPRKNIFLPASRQLTPKQTPNTPCMTHALTCYCEILLAVNNTRPTHLLFY